ncbi:transglutaminase domain-containing protein [Rufibacter tibetensis]|uniref:Transglutaminase-like domain-containing protein n=1 Tax=Rufibacter tibetensis TaxID=512763 RepID=A0A0N7HW30_9BACT|nr:transglutaminase domain-containing protein [Rufibacter tibetensis]ALI98104.1 hypothetical protein DC20_02815 [Rufibacter tibetensis]
MAKPIPKLKVIMLLVLGIIAGYRQLAAASESYSFRKVERLFDKGQYEKVLEEIRLLEKGRFGKEGSLKYSMRNEVRYYHYKLSSRLLANRTGSLQESVGLYKRLLVLDSTRQFLVQPQYLEFREHIRKSLEKGIAGNQLAFSRLLVDALALQGDTVPAYWKVYPTKEELLQLANKEALRGFIKKYDYAEVDRNALLVEKQSNIENQAWALTKELKYDFEKVRAIYIWIVHKIHYDYNYRIYDGLTTFKANKGVCSGFSYLFQEMCSKAGIKAFRVVGKANNSPITNHAWNMVEVEGFRFLIEATWASCVKEKTDYYYFISEKELSRTHKPEKVY